jgi:hypothetical protein
MKMNVYEIFLRMFRRKAGEKGVALVIVMTFVGLMSLSLMFLVVMVRRDMDLVTRITYGDQARFLAEAGINHAFADIKKRGFLSRQDFTGTLATGSYSVAYDTIGGRERITSTGTASGVSRVVTAEVRDNTPTAMNYFSGAGNDIKINALVARAFIVGDIHANNNVYLKAGPLIARLEIDGDVSATGIVQEGSIYDRQDGFWGAYLDRNVYINDDNNDDAVVYENQPRITFPTFDYNIYKLAAIDSGDYYSSDTTFTDATLSPGNGIVYVDGDAEFRGNCVLNGGIIADNILVRNTIFSPARLTQNKVLNKNVLIARNGNIRVWGRLTVNEALVFASQDILSVEAAARLEIDGIFLAGRDVNMWNVLTYIEYTYVPLSPDDMAGEDGRDIFEVVAWTR